MADTNANTVPRAARIKPVPESDCLRFVRSTFISVTRFHIDDTAVYRIHGENDPGRPGKDLLP